MTFIYLLFLFDQELNLIKVLEVYFHEDKLSWFYLPITHTLPQRNTDVCTRNSLSYYLDIYFYLYNLRISKKKQFPLFLHLYYLFLLCFSTNFWAIGLFWELSHLHNVFPMFGTHRISVILSMYTLCSALSVLTSQT